MEQRASKNIKRKQVEKSFTQHIQNRIAETCIGASSLRNQGASGILRAARKYFAAMPLNKFCKKTENKFLNALNEETEKLRCCLPQNAQNWGTARKAINLFLRDALYNRYLSEQYRLDLIEEFLEVPLDGDVSYQLHQLPNNNLPKWKSIKSLTKDESDLYQSKAKEFANELGINRIHLDLIWWRAEKQKRS